MLMFIRRVKTMFSKIFKASPPVEILKDLTELCDRHGIKYFFECKTRNLYQLDIEACFVFYGDKIYVTNTQECSMCFIPVETA